MSEKLEHIISINKSFLEFNRAINKNNVELYYKKQNLKYDKEQ